MKPDKDLSSIEMLKQLSTEVDMKEHLKNFEELLEKLRTELAHQKWKEQSQC